MKRPLVLALSLAACSTSTPRRSWDDVHLGARPAPPPAAPAAELPPLDPATATPMLADAQRPPSPQAYGQQGRLVANADGPVDPLPARELALPEALWLPALPDDVARAFASGALSPDLAIDGAADADVNGDGVDDLVVLARPIALFEREGAHRYALLLALTPAPGGHRLLARARFSPQRHGTPEHWCHAEYRLAGFLQRGTARAPIVWEEQGVRCAQLVGGGFDRVLHVVGFEGGAAAVQRIVVSGARLGERGAADAYDGAAWVADADGDGKDELVVRGIASVTRPCGGEPAWWREELAARVVDPQRIRAMRDGRALLLPDGTLPEALTLRHAAACGTGRQTGLARQRPWP